MYLRRHAYYCDYGVDADRCLAGVGDPNRGWELARARFGNKRVAGLSARSTVLATAAVLRCTEDYEAGAGDGRRLAELPLFVASGTGLAFAAHFARALANAGSTHRSLEAAMFSGSGPHVVECMRYSVPIVTGMISQLTGVTGENRSLSGNNAGLIALRQARRFLHSGRASEVLVVCAESLIEWSPEQATAAEEPRPREIGCAFIATLAADRAIAQLHLDEVGLPAARRRPFAHFEAANACANVCWALEQEGASLQLFEEQDLNHRCSRYGVERMEAC